jgi:CRP-like cAMP-binding protein
MTKLKELEKRLKDEPENLGLRVLVAGALHEAGRRDDSIELYRSVAEAYRDQGRVQQAITVCRSVLAIAPGDPGSQQLLDALVASRPGRPTQLTEPPPDRLPPPPRPGSSSGAPELIEGDEPGSRAPLDVTPLPAPLPYHVADPTQSIPVVPPSEAMLSLQEELARYPQIVGIANAARQISASLIASQAGDADGEADGDREPQTRRMPRLTTDDLHDHEPLRPGADGDSDDSDDETTLVPVIELPEIPELVSDDATVMPIEDELTEPREMPLRTRPPSIAPPTAATGPLTGAFFVPVPPRHRAAVLQRFRRRMAAHGTTVIQRGETGHGLVVVVHGLLELHAARPDGAPIVLGAIAAGEYVGEASLLARAPAATDVVAAVDSELLVLGEADFHDVVGSYPALRTELRQIAERRLRELGQRLHG